MEETGKAEALKVDAGKRGQRDNSLSGRQRAEKAQGKEHTRNTATPVCVETVVLAESTQLFCFN